MKYISLLPPEIKKKREAEKRQGKINFVLTIFIIALLVINVFFFINYFFASSNLRSLQSERENLEQTLAALTEFEELYQEITALDDLIRHALGSAPSWSNFFRDVARAMPINSWFSDLTLSYSGNSGSLNIRGWAYDHGGLADLINKLSTLEQLEQVQSRTSSATDYQGREAIQFQLDANVLPDPDLAAREEEEQ